MQVKLKKITGDIYEFQPVLRKKSNFVSKQKYQKLLGKVQKLETWRKSLEYYWDTGGFTKKSHRPKTTVLCFFADGKESVYHFHSEPDYKHIKQEMIADSAKMAIVLKEDMPDKCCYISLNHYFVFHRAELKVQIAATRNVIASNASNKEIPNELSQNVK
jgi:hypothetical protein